MTTVLCNTWVSIPVKGVDGQILDHTPMRYDLFVLTLMKKQDDYKMLSHGGRGVCTEAGEINDCIKRHLDYEQEMNIANLIEEIGDMRFYLQALQNHFGITEQQILQYNALKLSTRYNELKYSDEQAKLRRDKS